MGHPPERATRWCTRHRSRWSCRSDSSSCTPTKTTSCSTPSSAPGPHWSRPPASSADASATTSTPVYVARARERLAQERRGPTSLPTVARRSVHVEVPLPDEAESFQAWASREGKAAQSLAAELLEATGFHIVRRNFKVRGLGVMINFEAVDAVQQPWWFDASGAFTSHRGGLLRTDTVWKALGRASVVQTAVDAVRLGVAVVARPEAEERRRQGTPGEQASEADLRRHRHARRRRLLPSRQLCAGRLHLATSGVLDRQGPHSGAPAVVSLAVLHGEPPQVLVADDDTLHWLLALEVVARTTGRPAQRRRPRSAKRCSTSDGATRWRRGC